MKTLAITSTKEYMLKPDYFKYGIRFTFKNGKSFGFVLPFFIANKYGYKFPNIFKII